MAKQIWKPGTLLSPLPAVLVTCGTMEESNIITISWTGIVCSDPAMTYVSVRPERWSYHLIKENMEFVINLSTEALARATDYCGCKTGKTTDKFADMKLTKAPASAVSCPLIDESPINLECRVTEVKPLGSHDMFLAEIVAVDVDESLIDDSGKLNLKKAGIMFASHGEYFAQGRKIGQLGYTVKKRKGNFKGKPSDKKK